MICFPNAKINLGLNVVEKRPDGYHNIETVFLPVDIKDALEFVPAPDLDAPYEWHSSGLEIDAPAEGNICIKALMAMRQRYPQIPNLRIHLHKHIPFGAGLGGGSADGAFMLVRLNDYFNLGATPCELKIIAAALGADCAFFIDNRPSFATGIGNVLEPIDLDLKGHSIVVVVPPVHISTPEAYRQIKPAYPSVRLKDALRGPIHTWRHTVANDFEGPVFQMYPIIQQAKEDMYAQGAVYAGMSGSGSSVFGIFAHKPLPDFLGMFCFAGEL
ncbi:MAG: 4-(cytidine 5'-diphospho)-2-C-methyl-D-erythritol kinase [Breznakibacter sp.]